MPRVSLHYAFGPVAVSSGQNVRIAGLAAQAQQAMLAGRLDEAAGYWGQVLGLAPEHPEALFRVGQHALIRKEWQRARELLERAVEAAPTQPLVALNLAFAFRALGDGQSEMAALTRALTIDPYFLPALLARGQLEERNGEVKRAARTYKDALSIAPPEEQLSAELKASLRHARAAVNENSAALDEYLRARLDAVRGRHAGADLGRFEECKAVALGQKKVYTQQPSMLHIPGLPAVQFYRNQDFPWLAQLEAATDSIRDELLLVLKEDGAEMRPYVAHPAGAPVAQWAELNHSPRWSAFFLWEDGRRIENHCARCPRTAALLETIPMMDLERFAPTVLFSILSPRTHIPPHSSVTNARLVVHLPLIAPPSCRFRVGSEVRDWREGSAWIFDDTIEHEAWNDSDSLRVILMIDIWNPHLSQVERELVAALLNGMRDYYDAPIPRP